MLVGSSTTLRSLLALTIYSTSLLSPLSVGLDGLQLHFEPNEHAPIFQDEAPDETDISTKVDLLNYTKNGQFCMTRAVLYKNEQELIYDTLFCFRGY
jgi:hypothetical protein